MLLIGGIFRLLFYLLKKSMQCLYGKLQHRYNNEKTNILVLWMQAYNCHFCPEKDRLGFWKKQDERKFPRTVLCLFRTRQSQLFILAMGKYQTDVSTQFDVSYAQIKVKKEGVNYNRLFYCCPNNTHADSSNGN